MQQTIVAAILAAWLVFSLGLTSGCKQDHELYGRRPAPPVIIKLGDRLAAEKSLEHLGEEDREALNRLLKETDHASDFRNY